MDRQTVSSGTEWESRVGYSRAVRVGPHVHVSGTTATDDEGELVSPGDPRRQTERAIGNVTAALEAVGAAMTDVVRTRMYVTDIDEWEQVGAAHAEAFGDIRPATSLVEVNRLVDPDMVVELEAVAVVDDDSGRAE